MAIAIKKSTSKISKKNLEQELLNKLEKALAGFKDILGEKKFKNRIKKAGKLFLKGKPKDPQAVKAAPIVKKLVPAAKKKAANGAIKKPATTKK